MGYYTEINTLIRLPEGTAEKSLEVGQRHSFTLKRERVIPLRIALLMIDNDWKFYGYCRVLSAEIKEEETRIEIEILSIFEPAEQELYQKKFIEAGKLTGEVK